MPDSLLSLFPVTFPALALAHFVALLSPGPDFFLILGHAVRRRFKGSALICVGIATGNSLYITLAVAGWSGLKDSPLLYRAVEVAGAAFLAWMAVLLFRSSRQAAHLHIAERTALSPGAQYIAGLTSALLNPKNALFYLTLMTGLLGAESTLAQQTAAGVWMTLVVLGWDLALVAVISRPRAQRVLQRNIPRIESLSSMVLMGIALYIVVMPWL